MDDVETTILSYPHLPAERQKEVEAFVESNPEWVSLLQDVRALEGLSATAQEDLPDDALLASYVVIQHLHPNEVPSRLRDAFSRLQGRIEEDEDLHRKADAARRRLRDAEVALDPVSDFEMLTGHSLEEEGNETRATATDSQKEASTLSVLDVFANLPLFLRRGAVMALVLMGVYGTLFAVSVTTQSPLDRLAAVDVSQQVLDSYTATETRSAVPAADTATVDQRYLEALTVLRSARSSTFGLFPRYAPDKLDRAEHLLEGVLDDIDPQSFLALEAHFYLGKISLAQEDIEAARDHFKTVVRRQGRKSPEATEILKALQERQAE